jgi:alpha-N-arabinofuranosidase
VKNGTLGYADVADVPYIDVVATRSPDGQRITLYCVNRSLTDDTQTEIDLGTFWIKGIAKVEQISAVSRYVMNDEVEPKRVVPSISSLNVSTKRVLTITLPHESVTVIRLERK